MADVLPLVSHQGLLIDLLADPFKAGCSLYSHVIQSANSGQRRIFFINGDKLTAAI
jgi:hypothetical protein